MYGVVKEQHLLEAIQADEVVNVAICLGDVVALLWELVDFEPARSSLSGFVQWGGVLILRELLPLVHS